MPGRVLSASIVDASAPSGAQRILHLDVETTASNLVVTVCFDPDCFIVAPFSIPIARSGRQQLSVPIVFSRVSGKTDTKCLTFITINGANSDPIKTVFVL